MSELSRLAQAPPRTLADTLAPADNSFGVLRLAFALVVLVSHSLWFATGRRDVDPMIALTGFTSGEHAVQMFFLLSGLLVALALERSRSVTDFAVARGLRIFPGLAVCVGLTALVLGPLVTVLPLAAYVLHPDFVGYIAKTTALVTASARLPGVFEANPLPGLVNGSLWTLKFEIVCYAGLALIGCAQFLDRGRRTAATWVLVAVIALASGALPLDTTRYSTAQNLAYFAIPFSLGVLACLLRDHVRVTWVTPFVLAIPAWFGIGTVVQHITLGLGRWCSTSLRGCSWVRLRCGWRRSGTVRCAISAIVATCPMVSTSMPRRYSRPSSLWCLGSVLLS